MLDQLQQEDAGALGDQPVQGSVIASDFANATAIAELCDQAIVDCLMQELLPVAVPAFKAAAWWIRRCAVIRVRCRCFRRKLPPASAAGNLTGAGGVCRRLRMGSREFGAKGLCQERAYVCGLEAANSLLRRGIMQGGAAARNRRHPVIPIRADEPQVLLGRALNKLVMDPLEGFGIRWPWLAS